MTQHEHELTVAPDGSGTFYGYCACGWTTRSYSRPADVALAYGEHVEAAAARPNVEQPREKPRLSKQERFYLQNPEDRPAGFRARLEALTARAAELAAVPVPSGLRAPADSPDWRRRIYEDAADLYREVYCSPDRQAKLSAVGEGMGRERRAAALKLLRSVGVVGEEKRALPDARGHLREQVVLRVEPERADA